MFPPPPPPARRFGPALPHPKGCRAGENLFLRFFAPIGAKNRLLMSPLPVFGEGSGVGFSFETAPGSVLMNYIPVQAFW
jgi:hypothetical protein